MVQTSGLTIDTEPFPGYKLHTYLGRGAWGEVWQGTGPDGTPIALKFIRCANSKSASREIRAIQQVRQLKHPNIVKIHRIWGDANYLVVVMELAQGTLLDLLDVYMEEFGHPIVPQHLCHYLLQAASALDFLNTRQHLINGQRMAIRHCDVKPSNMLIIDNVVKLADFSLSVQTSSNFWYYERVGTFNYAAPEVFQGWLSDRSDQYSLAVSYCQLRAGFLPFPPPPKPIDPNYVRPEPNLSGLTAAEQEVIQRALNPTPQSRWPSCVEMVERLQKAVE